MSAKALSQSTLVIDIAPGIIKGAFVGYPKGGVPVILFEKTRKFQYNERMLSTLQELLHDVLESLPHMSNEFSRQPEHVLISLSKPWSKTDARVVSKIEEELVRVFGFKKGVAIENSTEVYLRGAASLYEINHIMLARVLEDSMELRLVEKGKSDEYLRVPFGYADIRDSLSQDLNMARELVDSYITLAAMDLWDDEIRRTVSKSLEDSERSWYKLVKDIKRWPQHILLISEEPYAKVFTTYFKDLIHGARVTHQDSTTLLASYSRNLL